MKQIGSQATFITLTKSFYEKKAIVKAVAAFCTFFEARLEEQEEQFLLIMTKINQSCSPQELVDNFLNYVLGVMQHGSE